MFQSTLFSVILVRMFLRFIFFVIVVYNTTLRHHNVNKNIPRLFGGGRNRGVNLPSPYFLSQFLPPLYFFEPISPSSLNGYVSFSPSSLLFPPIFPSSQLFWAISPSSLFSSSPLCSFVFQSLSRVCKVKTKCKLYALRIHQCKYSR